MPAFFTIGHSTRSIDGLVALLRSACVELVVDVRAIPRSRTNPQFNLDVLPAALAAAGIDYEHLPALGGRRGRAAADSANDFWQNASFRNYADYAATAAFRAGLSRLRELGARQACAIMCAEAVWWRCHRRIIADYLLADGATVFHILGPTHIEPARSDARRAPPAGRHADLQGCDARRHLKVSAIVRHRSSAGLDPRASLVCYDASTCGRAPP